MAKKNKVEIDVKVDDKGTTKKVGLNAKNASKGLDDVGKSARTADRNLKGAAQASSNTTKNFSKMAQGTGGLVAAYATLAANIFAVTAAYGFLKRAGDLVALTKGQEAYAIKTGKSMKLLTSRMQEATGGLLGFDEASQAAAIGTAAGLSSDQLEGLAKIAKNASVALGRDLTDSFNRLTKGAIKAEPELLDELGIVLRLEKASKDYALALNKDVKALTQFEKSQAVVNAVLAQGNEKFDDVGKNVNQIARLGKKFDDLVKSISRFIEPLATFVSGALADNVKALAAAFTVMGLSITKALIPAAPAMTNFADTVANSRAALMGAAGTSTLGKNIAAGNIGARELSAIDRGAGAETSSVINKKAEVDFKKHTMILRADHQRMIAANSTGMKKYAADFKMRLAIMQAEHGKAMGAMKMAGATFASGLNKAMSAVAFLGILSVALAMMKQLIEYFKDPAVRALEENAKLVKERYAEQNKELSKMVSNFKEAGSDAQTLVKQANVLSNFSFSGVEGMTKGLKDATLGKERGNTGTRSVDKDVATTSILEGTSQVIDSLKLQSTALEDFGQKVSKTYERNVNALAVSQTAIAKGAGSTTEEMKAYNAAIQVQRDLLEETAEMGAGYATIMNASRAAIESLKETSEGFINFRNSAKDATSSFSQFLEFNNKFSASLNQIKNEFGDEQTLESYFGAGVELSSYVQLLGVKAKEMTVQAAINALNVQAETIRSDEFEIERRSLQTKKQHIINMRSASKLQGAQLKRLLEISKVEDQIAKQDALLNQQTLLGAEADATKTRQLKIQREILVEQLRTAQELNNETTQITQAFKNGLEGSMTTTIADLIKGNEGSLKMAMMKIAKGAIEAVADKLAEQVTLNITDFIFGKDPKLVAQEENTAAIKENTAALTGEFGPNVGPQLPSSISNVASKTGSSSKKGFFSTLFTGAAADKGTAINDAGTKNINDVHDGPVAGGELNKVVTSAKQMGGLKGIFDGFVMDVGAVFSGDTPFLEGLGDIFKNGLQGFGDLFGDLGGFFKGMFGGGGEGGGFISTVLGAFGLGARSGGVFSGGRKMQGYASGGIARGSTSGYPVVLHGTEAVVPLGSGNSIPVEMKGGGNVQNNVVVNVSTDGTSRTESSSGMDADRMGQAVAAAVQAELQNQKRSGGILNPYGVA